MISCIEIDPFLYRKNPQYHPVREQGREQGGKGSGGKGRGGKGRGGLAAGRRQRPWQGLWPRLWRCAELASLELSRPHSVGRDTAVGLLARACA